MVAIGNSWAQRAGAGGQEGPRAARVELDSKICCFHNFWKALWMQVSVSTAVGPKVVAPNPTPTPRSLAYWAYWA